MYALAAIPIWFTKMGLFLTGLGIITNLLKNAISWITNKFEDLMYFDFAALFSGNSNNSNNLINYDGANNSFKFFPSVTSPFFILWISFFSATIIFLMLLIMVSLMKRFNWDNELNPKGEGGSFVTAVLTSGILIFFIPFLLFSSMTITSIGVKAIFKNSTNTATPGGISEYRGNFNQKLNEASRKIYDLGEENTMVMQDGSVNALFSHTIDNKFDNQVDDWANKSPTIIKPFSKIKAIFSRINFELAYLSKNAENTFDSSTTLLITEAQQQSQRLQNEWLNNKLKDNLDYLVTQSSEVSLTKKSENTAGQIDFAATQIKNYLSESLTFFNKIRELIAQKDLIGLSLNTGITPDKDILSNKLNNLFTGGVTAEILFLENYNKDNSSNPLEVSQIDHAQKMIAFLNLYSLAKVYLVPEGFNSTQKWSTSFIYPQGKDLIFSSDSGLMDINNNLEKLSIGYNTGSNFVSFRFLAQSFSAHKVTTLPQVIEEITSINSSNIFAKIGMMFIAWMVVGMILGILFQLVKRLIERLLKLIWLWIVGGAIIVSSLKDGSQGLKIWFGLVIGEMLVLLGLIMGWEIWKNLTPLMWEWLGNDNNMESITVVPSSSQLGFVIFKIFISLGLLELIIKSSDWLAASMGKAPSFQNVGANLRKAQNIQRSATKKNISGRDLQAAHKHRLMMGDRKARMGSRGSRISKAGPKGLKAGKK